jgi:16S rRNA (cytosine967-C5)-methyltransferase
MNNQGGRGGGDKRKSGSRAPSKRAESAKAGRVASQVSAAQRAINPRWVALQVIAAVDEGAYANLILPQLLSRSKREGLADRDIGLVTELVYGTIRMQRQLDALLQPFLSRPPDAEVLRVLRLGAYQIRHMRIPSHAAVSETVEMAPARGRGFTNAVLRKLSSADPNTGFASLGEELSYPEWIVKSMIATLGQGDAVDVLQAMNIAAEVHTRADGYVQDLASQSVAGFVGAKSGERVLDMCAAPGGKATALAGLGAYVVAADLHQHRVGLIAQNVESLGLQSNVGVLRCDARQLPLRSGSFDRVLLDAPCSGFGSLRRRPDARWRIKPADVVALVALQRSLFASAVEACRSGGVVVYSACTLTREETLDFDTWVAETFPDLVSLEAPSTVGWQPWGRGALLLPAATDGMFVVAYRKP